jgi:hypothetical protein
VFSLRLAHLLFLHPGPPGINCCSICTQFQCHKPLAWPKLRFMKVWPDWGSGWSGFALCQWYVLEQSVQYGRGVSFFCAPLFLPFGCFFNDAGSWYDCETSINSQNDIYFAACIKARCHRDGRTGSEKVGGSFRDPGTKRELLSGENPALVRHCFKTPQSPFPTDLNRPGERTIGTASFQRCGERACLLLRNGVLNRPWRLL